MASTTTTTTTMSGEKMKWFKVGFWRKQVIICQQIEKQFQPEGFWGDQYPVDSYTSMILLTLSLILCVTTFTLFLLKPLRMPFTAQMIGGILIMGLIFSNTNVKKLLIFPYVFQYILKTLSFLGFMFHSLMLGVETNMSLILKRMNRKSAIIGLSGFIVSTTLSVTSLLLFVSYNDFKIISQGYIKLIALNAQTFFMVTCNHLNDLGINNSELGRLACTISLFVDISGMIITFICFELIPTIRVVEGTKWYTPLAVIGFYGVLFGGVRPMVLRILGGYIEGQPFKAIHLATMVVIAVVIAGVGELLGQMFAVFIFALSLPEDPLSSVLSKWFDAMTFGVFFPIYCAMQGLQTDITALEPTKAFRIEIGLLCGSIGKFFGTCMSSMFIGLPLSNALALSLIMTCKGLFDIVALGLWSNTKEIDIQEYTVATFHFLVGSGALLPLVRFLYKPSSEYSNILGTSVMDVSQNGTLKTMACIHKEENIPGIIRLIEAFDPSQNRPVPLIVLQLIQLIGRVSMPILGPLDQVKASGILGPKLIRCERIVESISHLERIAKGFVRVQHFISVASYDTMHNDVCNLAYEMDISLLIVPFHVQPNEQNKDAMVEGTSTLAIRSVNKMILENAPCAVGLLIDRTKLHLSISMTQVYRVAIIYIGGLDDREALAYINLFGTNPSINVTIICLKPTVRSQYDCDFDHELIDEIAMKIKSNERMSIDEVNVKDGAETTDYLVSMKDKADLIVAGRYHDPKCGPLFGLSDGWIEYPELGILGDLLASSDFKFSVLIVHSCVDVDQL
ncbi:hypothetical protein RND81_13G118500 [Saponaria officinalis]|uniref:Cation/H+ exchanger domain-containing protein n=1 Tax=Saponaria officinalis TaxID=3572 RepID=A0AAW1GWV0_SAPOF